MEQEELSELEAKVLEVERGWWNHAKTREQAITDYVGVSVPRYYLLLSQMLDSARVWQADPVLVDRLRRLRDNRLAERGQFPDSSDRQ